MNSQFHFELYRTVVNITVNMQRAVTFSNEEWNQRSLFKRMVTNKKEFLKEKSAEYFQNRFVDMENENDREDGDEKEEEEEERKIKEEEEIREEEKTF